MAKTDFTSKRPVKQNVGFFRYIAPEKTGITSDFYFYCENILAIPANPKIVIVISTAFPSNMGGCFMKILNLGSLNLDYVYTVPHFVQGGETIATTGRKEFCGGKGLNQSIALARAGATVFHAGKIGPEGNILKSRLHDSGVDTRFVDQVVCATGHAVIQVESTGQNCILIYGGANQCISTADVDRVLEFFEAGDILLLQNETSARDYAIVRGAAKGMKIALNPSPMDEELRNSPALKHVDLFLLNEVEGCAFTGATNPETICEKMHDLYPKAVIVLTLGSDGVVYFDGENRFFHGIYQVQAVDTTAAGDTFAGFFLAGIAAGITPQICLELASKASALAVSKPGASDSIPTMEEVLSASLTEKARGKWQNINQER